MVSAKRLLATMLIALLVAAIATAFVSFGIQQFRILVYISVPIGAGAVATGLVCLITGTLKKDLDS